MAGPFASVQADDDFPAGVEVRDYGGWTQSIYLNATEIAVQAVIVPAVGGRLVHFSLGGENILYENPATRGKTAFTDENLWLGGYVCDVGPETRPLPNHAAVLQAPATWAIGKPFAASVTNDSVDGLNIQISKDFLVSPDTGELGVMQRMANVSKQDVSYCFQDRTMCKGGGYVLIPLNKKSRFKAGWSQMHRANGREFYDGDQPDITQARVVDGVLVVSTVGNVTKIGADSTAGWIAYAWEKILLIKYFPWYADGNYSDGGNTVEVYFDQRAVELSPLSPEKKLAPGQSFSFPEKWMMVELKKEPTSWEEARKLVHKVPSAPSWPAR